MNNSHESDYRGAILGYDIVIIMEESFNSHCLLLRSSYHEYYFKRYDQKIYLDLQRIIDPRGNYEGLYLR